MPAPGRSSLCATIPPHPLLPARFSLATPPAPPSVCPTSSQQQQRNRLGSGGSGDGPSVSWPRHTRPPAAVTGRGDAPNRSRNRSSSGNRPGARSLGLRAGGLGGTAQGWPEGRGWEALGGADGLGGAGRHWAGPARARESRLPSPSSGQFPKPLLLSQLLQRFGGFL
ncbi:hypothetical protein P7K49_034641 [Saguinus oedipus]|uniref:Uncharacterized protein n=1 Tax=Saguinus oedipus TaxID=9490 RepID=A0ABQ9TVY0_SAGOE|nr:hypothetical protein P7K49_034641 [Saguinus oedipus]